MESGEIPDPNEVPEDGLDESPIEGEPLPDDIAPEEEMVEEAPIKAASDLKRWEVKALHDLKSKGRVYRTFASAYIDADEHEAISAALKAAQTAQEVKAAFKRNAVDTLLDSVDDEARVWAEEAMK